MPGGDGFTVEPKELQGYSSMLGRAVDQFGKIGEHAKSKGGDTSGFTGLLALLVPIVDGVVGLYTDAVDSAQGKLGKVKDNLDGAVAHYTQTEAKHSKRIGEFKKNLDAVPSGGAGGGN